MSLQGLEVGRELYFVIFILLNQIFNLPNSTRRRNAKHTFMFGMFLLECRISNCDDPVEHSTPFICGLGSAKVLATLVRKCCLIISVISFDRQMSKSLAIILSNCIQICIFLLALARVAKYCRLSFNVS